MRLDVHQHIWSEPLIRALAQRECLPFVRRENELTVLHIAGERPYVVDLEAEDPARRAALVAHDGLDRALLSISSPVGIESLPRREARELIDIHLDAVLALGEPFGVWGSVPLEEIEAGDLDRVLARGCVGLSLPAGALASTEGLRRLRPLLERLEALEAPLLVHPGPAPWSPVAEARFCDPLWWPALTSYVAEMQAAWLAFQVEGRRAYPALRVIFTLLAGGAPLLAERLVARGGPALTLEDPLSFYESSSHGPAALDAIAALVGERQLIYGSDRPVADPHGAAALPPQRALALAERGAGALGPRVAGGVGA